MQLAWHPAQRSRHFVAVPALTAYASRPTSALARRPETTPASSLLHQRYRNSRGSASVCRAAQGSTAESGKAASSEPEETQWSQEISLLGEIVRQLRDQPCDEAKVALLLRHPRVTSWLTGGSRVADILSSLPANQAYALLCLPAMGQQHVLQVLPAGEEELSRQLQALACTLLKADVFYSSLGGIVGYQAKCLELIQHGRKGTCNTAATECDDVEFHMPQGPNLDGIAGRQMAAAEAAKGLEALPHMAEIWPLGGAGDRLGLVCERTGKSVPTAVLPYCGRTLLEGLVRDLQARESLYQKLFGSQCTTPIVIMTSDAKDNHRLVLETLESFKWFGRGKENFRVICQPLVPVVSASTGEWLLPEALAPMMKPGGHGAIWKLMLDEGAFSWLSGLDRQAALVRQISNPMAGADATMLALTGAGYADGRSFGFACCERTVGAAEGMNVLMQRRLPKADGSGFEYAYNVTNVEYTEFERLGISDQPAADSKLSLLPANTNILYVSLKAAEAAVKAGVASGGGAALPGMIFNGKKTVKWVDAATGRTRKEAAGRMECTMQNLVDSLAQRFQEPIPLERHGELNTFVVYNKRRRTTSSAKRKRVPGSHVISQTPDGSFRDLMLNAAEVLQRCGVSTPETGDVEKYLQHGPDFVFLFNPALGPLWDVIAQKVRGGALARGSELVLEIAEAAITDLRLDGSLLVESDCPLGRQLAPGEEGLRSSAVPFLGQRTSVTYRQSGSEAIQYSSVMPDLAETSGTVVPLQRKKSPQSLTVVGGGDVAEKVFQKPSEGEASGDLRSAFSSQCPRVRMNGVVIQNEGIDWSHPGNVYWQHKVCRREQVRVILHGQAEFEASHICLIGSHTFEVPDGYKMAVSAAPGGGIRRSLSPLRGRRPSWQWRYLSGRGGDLQLQMESPIWALPGIPLSSRPMESETPFSYMI